MSRLDAIALALLAATALGTWLVDHVPAPLPAWAALTVVALALTKGFAVALDYMGLRHAPPLWRRLVLGWLVGVWVVIALVDVTITFTPQLHALVQATVQSGLYESPSEVVREALRLA